MRVYFNCCCSWNCWYRWLERKTTFHRRLWGRHVVNKKARAHFHGCLLYESNRSVCAWTVLSFGSEIPSPVKLHRLIVPSISYSCLCISMAWFLFLLIMQVTSGCRIYGRREGLFHGSVADWGATVCHSLPYHAGYLPSARLFQHTAEFLEL